MPYAHSTQDLFELLPHRLRAPGNDVALGNVVLPGRFAQPSARGGLEALAQRRKCPIPRRVEEALEDMKAAIVEIVGVTGIQPFGFFVAVGNGDQLQVSGAIGISVDVTARRSIPESLHHFEAALITKEAEVAVAIVVVQAQIPCFKAAAARDPYWRPRFLQRPWPNVDVS